MEPVWGRFQVEGTGSVTTGAGAPSADCTSSSSSAAHRPRLDFAAFAPSGSASLFQLKTETEQAGRPAMKIRNSLKSLKSRHRDCRVIRRRGRTYVINKTNRRFKARQG